MKEIVDWLIRIEHISGKFYRDAAAFFTDPELVAFLEHTARDETRHADIMAAAADALKTHPHIRSAVKLDQQTKDAIEAPFLENHQKLKTGRLTLSDLVDCIVATEFSEWNHIFLYAVNSLKAIEPDFKPAAAMIQHHLKHVEHYVSTLAEGQQKIAKIKALEPVWKERLLIIEDDLYLAELFNAVLHADGTVDMATDGKAGLEKIRQCYYRLIISDVNLPGMDGITVFRRASEQFPDIGARYLFVTGNPDPGLIDYFQANKLKYLTKPASIHAIKCHVLEVMHNIPCN